MTAQELGASIIDFAIQGKLVEQLPEESSLEGITSIILEDTMPFDIPETWKWVRLSTIAEFNPKNNISDEMETSFIPMNCVQDGFRNEHSFEVRIWKTIKKGFAHFADGDIGIAKITPCFQNRKSVIFHNLINGVGAGTTELSIIRVTSSNVLPEYLLWVFKSKYFISNGVKSFTGTAGQQRIHKDYLKNFAIPLPPLAEQRRIVAKIEELLPLIEEYGAAEQRLTALNTEFPDKLRKSILQQAVMGKLTERDPADESASELLGRIRAEKARLVKEGKLKKEKPLPPITEDEVPFEIPEGWEWVRLGDVVSVYGGKRIPAGKSLTDTPTAHKYLRVTDMKNQTVKIDGLRYVPDDVFPAIQRYTVGKDDIYITVAGTIGAVGTIPECIDGINLTENADKLVFSILNKMWLVWALSSPVVQDAITAATNQMSQPKLSIISIQNLIIPLPPIAEQQRIVERVEELLAVCGELS